MDNKKLDPKIWDIAKSRAAKCVRSNSRLKGMEEMAIADDIALSLFPQQNNLLKLISEGKEEEAEMIIRAAVRQAENSAICEARKSIRALVPYQVRAAKESGKIEGFGVEIVASGKEDIVDKAYSVLGRDMVIWRHKWCGDGRLNKCVRFALNNLSSLDGNIGFLYLKLGSWTKVAKQMSLSEGDFRRKHLSRFKKNFADIWHLIW